MNKKMVREAGTLATFSVYVNGLYVDRVYRDSLRYSEAGIKHLLVAKGGFPLNTEIRRTA
jgi:hypothetical protein